MLLSRSWMINKTWSFQEVQTSNFYTCQEEKPEVVATWESFLQYGLSSPLPFFILRYSETIFHRGWRMLKVLCSHPLVIQGLFIGHFKLLLIFLKSWHLCVVFYPKSIFMWCHCEITGMVWQFEDFNIHTPSTTFGQHCMKWFHLCIKVKTGSTVAYNLFLYPILPRVSQYLKFKLSIRVRVAFSWH